MEQQQYPETNLEKFLKTKPSMIIGVVVALLLGIVLMRFGVYESCCSLGYLLIACVALYVPKIFGLSKGQYLIIFGVVFFLVLTLVGAFVFSKPTLEKTEDLSQYNDLGFSNVRIETTENNGVIVYVHYEPTRAVEPTDIGVTFAQVKMITYTKMTTSDLYPTQLEATGTPGEYKAVVKTNLGNEIPYGFPYLVSFYAQYENEESGPIAESSKTVLYNGATNESEITKISLLGNAYNTGIVAVLFFLMMGLTAWSRKNLEKARAKMEAEGRLYPQGYGRCKECGAIVLPGETCCRKCGAYIDVPDELRHRKVDMIQCSECGAEIPENVKSCPKCGAVFDEEEEIVYVDSQEEIPAESKETVVCSECGAEIPEDAEVCPKCGVRFDEDDETVEEEKKD